MTSSGERVSCVVPAHNAERYLDEALASILAQSHRPFEVIVVDDASTDTTVAIVDRHGPPVRRISRNCGGPAATRNAGLEAATGDFVAFLDQDDLWHEDKLALQLERFRARPELDCSVTYAQMFWGAGPGEHASGPANPRLEPVPGYATTTLLAKREAFDRVGALDPRRWFTDSVDWFLRAREQGLRIELLHRVLTFRRLHETNLSHRRDDDGRDEFLELVHASLERRRQA